MLKAVLENLESLDKGLHSLYEKGADGKFYLGVEGQVPASRLDEFRANNIQLKQALEKFDGIDPTKYKELMDREAKLKEKKLIDAGDIDKVVEERVKSMRAEYDKQLEGLKKNNEAANSQLSALLIDSTVKSAAVTLGVVPTALDDVILRAKSTFQVKDGQVLAVNEKGEIRYGKDGTTPLTIADWTKDLKTSAPHLFEGVRGSNAPGNRGGSGHTDVSKMTSTQKISAGLAAQG